MKPAAIRLAVVTLLFLAWLGYLTFLVATRPHVGGVPLVVSRPQVLTSEVDVVAEVSDPRGPVKITKVLWPEQGVPLKEGESIKIDNLADCRPQGPDSVPDWSGPGEYLLPLRARKGAGGWEVAPVPDSPGFAGRVVRIYPWTRESEAQYKTVTKPE